MHWRNFETAGRAAYLFGHRGSSYRSHAEIDIHITVVLLRLIALRCLYQLTETACLLWLLQLVTQNIKSVFPL